MKYLFIGILVCSAIAALILIYGAKHNLYSATVFNIWHGAVYDDDSSKFGSDGPVIVYENGSIINYSIVPDGSAFRISKKAIYKTDTLTCRIDETNQEFSFRLKDSINTEKDEYDLPGRMFIISDIEGNFKGFVDILKAAGVINNNLNWIFGNGHIVLDGDFFDRWINVTECLWLIYKLEDEALKSGGKVHFILGNHEIMNLNEKYKYVRNKYKLNAEALGLEYKKWYAPDTELGKWLRSKNGIEKIGDYLFLHGGISKDFPKDKYTLTEINENIKMCIDRDFKDGNTSKDMFIGAQGPLWYRGIVDTAESREDVEQTLKSFNAKKMILGHTIVDEIKYLYGGKVIAIDLEHQINTANGKMYALWYEDGEFYVIDNKGNKSILK